MAKTLPCPHCYDGDHSEPAAHPWSVYVAPETGADRRPIRLHVAPSDGAHVAESDAQWIRDLINQARNPRNRSGRKPAELPPVVTQTVAVVLLLALVAFAVAVVVGTFNWALS